MSDSATSQSLASRATMAVVLLIGFYLLALIIAGTLLYIAAVATTSGVRIPVKLVLLCVGGGLVVIWSIIPRIDKFEAPGPQLGASEHPKLFEAIEEIGNATEQDLPKEVYLVPDVNAWVAERGGIMGLGSRRVMGVGLPLLQLLTVRQFKAVLAHEFGHYHGGDTKLGPWIHKTRAAIGRTLQNVAEHSSWLQAPFKWYGDKFLKITHGISRQQEFVADAVAAKTVDAPALIGGLENITRWAPAYGYFLENELLPVVKVGCVAPVLEGFELYRKSPAVSKAFDEAFQKTSSEAASSPYDTHPSLSERTQALGASGNGEGGDEASPALTLLSNPEAQDDTVLAMLFGPEMLSQLQPMNWSAAGIQLHSHQWRLITKGNGEAFEGLTPSDFPDLYEDPEQVASKMPAVSGPDTPAEYKEMIVAMVTQCALGAALLHQGWSIRYSPGVPVAVERKGEMHGFQQLCNKMVPNNSPKIDWVILCQSLGVADMDIGELARRIQAEDESAKATEQKSAEPLGE